MEENDFLIKGLSVEQLAYERMRVTISTKFKLFFLSQNMSMRQFAHKYHIPVRKIRKWAECDDYNFTLKEMITLAHIMQCRFTISTID